LPANKTYTIVYSSFAFFDDTLFINIENESIKKDMKLKSSDYDLNPIYAIANTIDETGMERVSSKNLTVLPNISGNAVETLIKTGMGVSSSNELSSQYNVRGGNFDENLIYVNDIQIYRPFLVRSGQQEGLSYINSDLVNGIKFSAGGFDSQYDDKMSSVLDITYKEPTKFAGSVSASLLGATAHIENVSKNQKLNYIAGIRYKRSDYFFKTFEVKGDYKPVFADFQGQINYNLTKKLTFSFLTNISSNTYNFIPKESETNFGPFNQPLQISVFYEGQEKDKYNTFFGSFSTEYKANKDLRFKFTASSYYTIESEKFDIEATYYLNQLNMELDSTETAGDSILNLGRGQYMVHARNYLNAFINEYAFRLYYSKSNHFIQFGLKFQNENIDDILSEWQYIDSAGYSINLGRNYNDEQVNLYSTIKAQNSLTTNRLSVFLQDSYNFFIGFSKVKITYGGRISYNDYNKEILFSPRFSGLITPNWDSDWFFRFSSGIYYQPPFYREIRKFDGTLVQNQKSQQSIHFVFGAYNTFKMWGRPFKLSSEFYFKKLNNLIPYELDNMRIRYYADQRSNGFAVGADFKIYGEFVPGTDSWLSLSLLKTMEDVVGDFYYVYYDEKGKITYDLNEAVDVDTIYPKYIPRPSDQIVSVGMFFQDYVPGNSDFKVSLPFFFTSPAPFGQTQSERYNATLRSSKPYLRADLGFSFLLKSEKRIMKKMKFFNNFSSIWGQFEIFNLMGVKNIASYNWIKTVPNTSNPNPSEYDVIAVPNRLTGRLINLKIIFNF